MYVYLNLRGGGGVERQAAGRRKAQDELFVQLSVFIVVGLKIKICHMTVILILFSLF